eukprot:jgi/Undpi1/1285/HiC_scaffold_11.g04677.m1
MGDTNSLSPGAEGGGSSSLAGITEACCLGEPWYGCGVAGGRVHGDLLGKDEWSNLRPVTLELPPCRCDDERPSSSCQQRRDDGNKTCRRSRENHHCNCNTAHGIAATLMEEDGSSPSAADSSTAMVAVVVFAVNAGCPLPTRRQVYSRRAQRIKVRQPAVLTR